MAQTPEVLQKKFGIQSDLGTVDVPRIVHAFQGVRPGDRKTLLSVFYPAVMAGALPGEGRNPRTRQVTQQEMGRRAGVSRVTVTRRLSKLASLAEGFLTAKDRYAHASQLRAIAVKRLDDHRASCELCAQDEALPCPTAAQLAGRIGELREPDAYQPPQPTPIFTRRRVFAQPNRMGMLLPQRTECWTLIESESGTEVKKFFDAKMAAKACERLIFKTGRRYQVEAVDVERDEHSGAPKQYHYPTIDQLEGSNWWESDFKKTGFKATSRWVWDSRILEPETGKPLDTLSRLVMSCYEQMGLLERFPVNGGKTKEAGVLQVSQKTVARHLGISVRALYQAHRRWAALGILRIVSDEREEYAPGKYRSQPQKVIYLPFRMLTEREAELESARMAVKVREIVNREGAHRLAQLMEAKRLHTELLAVWRGREHCLGAFYKELRRRLTAALIFPDLIDMLATPAPTSPPEANRS